MRQRDRERSVKFIQLDSVQTQFVSLHDMVEGELAHAQDLQAQVPNAAREEGVGNPFLGHIAY